MIPAWMTNQLGRVQERYLSRLCTDTDYAVLQSKLLLHNNLYEVLPAQEAGRVLELGCGPGKYLPMLAALGHTVVGVDPCKFPSWSEIQKIPHVEIRNGVAAESLPFDDEEFNHIVCLGALLYFDDPQAALREMFRVLKPGGKLLLRTVNKNNAYTRRTGKKLDPASRNLYSMDELESLLTNNKFAIMDKWAFGYWPPALTNLWWYLVCVWLPDQVQEFMSEKTPPYSRVVNVIVARKPHAVAI